MNDRVIRIGGASGFWGDSSLAVPQLLGHVDYLVFDYLAEVTMSILAAAKLKQPELGYATDFVDVVREHASAIASSGVKLIANAGGMNPRACAAALEAACAGAKIKIAVVEGDDVMPLVETLRAEGVSDLDDARALPDKIVTANAYLGALPIQAALAAGAQIVVTGRCVDSAVTLGALLHEFGWVELDRLAQGSIAGHVIECGCQGTGGLFTDWGDVPDWEHMGYPILECHADGSFVVTKAPGTGGLVTPATVGEQLLYEVGDPERYILPDVVCDLSHVKLEQVGADRVRVTNVKGRPPTDTYKVSATYLGGYKSAGQLTVIGFDAADKARRIADALLARMRGLFAAKKLGDFSDTLVEVLGAEQSYGPHSAATHSREVVLRISVRHDDKRALEIFAREIAPAGTAFAPGITGVGGRPQATPAISQYAFLLRKDRLSPRVMIDGRSLDVPIPTGTALPASNAESHASTLPPDQDPIEVPLVRIAHGRSGDKGDSANIGLLARTEALLPYLQREVTEARVKAYLAHLVLGRVRRHDVPGLHAVNLVCERALGGGGMASLRNDPYGKGMAQILLSMPVTVPAGLLP